MYRQKSPTVSLFENRSVQGKSNPYMQSGVQQLATTFENTGRLSVSSSKGSLKSHKSRRKRRKNRSLRSSRSSSLASLLSHNEMNRAVSKMEHMLVMRNKPSPLNADLMPAKKRRKRSRSKVRDMKGHAVLLQTAELDVSSQDQQDKTQPIHPHGRPQLEYAESADLLRKASAAQVATPQRLLEEQSDVKISSDYQPQAASVRKILRSIQRKHKGALSSTTSTSKQGAQHSRHRQVALIKAGPQQSVRSTPRQRSTAFRQRQQRGL